VWGHGLTSSRRNEDDAGLIEWSDLHRAADVLRYDARGHGESGFTTDPDDYGWDQLARDQFVLCDHLGIERAVVGGASMGAATALHAAALSPERVQALVLMIPPTAWETRAGQTDLYRQMADVVESSGVEPLIAARADVDPPEPFRDDARAWKDRRAAIMRAADPVRLAGVYRGAAVADLPAPEAVAAIGCPTLILAWTGDPGHPVSSAERLGELIVDSTVSIASTSNELAGWTRRVVDFLRAHA
jgi:pimeloyl-ACP methyl ester carboxylesterase